jgi:hypothetical protein
MLPRALAIWVVLLVIAVINGSLRVAFLEPSLGQYAAHVVSTLALGSVICLVAWLAINWVRPRSTSDALSIGALWLGLTVAFEFIAGRFLFDQAWAALLADYNVLQGRLPVASPGLSIPRAIDLAMSPPLPPR